MMKSLLIFSVFLCVAPSIRAATVRPADAVTEHHQEKEDSKPDADTPVAADRAAVLPQARFAFCLDGWLSFRGSCYYLGNHAVTWTDAESFCASFGGSLASVHSIWEYNFLQRMLRTGGHTLAWIGGYYFQGDWRWEDGTVFDYQNWGTPSSTVLYQCLQLNSQDSKGWSNHGCSMSFPFLCQVKLDC